MPERSSAYIVFEGDTEDTAAVLTYVLAGERSRYGEEQYELLHKSYETAREAHRGQTRESGKPYIAHAIETARILSDWRLDPATVCAALLHDTIEDTKMTREDLEREFPSPIPDLVDGVTKISKLNLNAGQDQQIESLRKLILAMSDDLRVTLIKLADRLHNMRTIDFLKPHKRKRIARATLDIYAPLAHRLGMTRARSELEDLCMKVLWPDEFRRLSDQVDRKRAQRDRHVKLTIDSIQKRLAEANIQAEVTGRPKHIYGIYHKMRSQGLDFDEIYDLIGIRIVCQKIEQCYETLGLIHQVYPPLGRFKDYIATPKENGYQSLHTTVIGLRKQVTEIQIRTLKMHQVAEYGVASHWKYKEGAGQSKIDPKLLWLRRLTEWLTDVRDPAEFMSALRHEAFSDTIQVLTPAGDVIELPAGSTPIDFAYAIHTDVGHHCDGAKVNRHVVPLKARLNSGDVVEILTRNNARPSVGWLETVKTGRARSKIRHFLRHENREENIRRGHEALQRALKARSINIPWSETEQKIEEALRSLRVHSVDELLSEIGFGAVKPVAAVNKMFPPEKRRQKEPAPGQEGPRAERRRRKRKSAGGVIVQGAEDSVVHFARCCNPLPGDKIVGFITVGRGVTIHKSTCSNLRKSIEANPVSRHRMLGARWDKENLPVRATRVRIVLSDRKGLLADICNLIVAQDVFIISSSSNLRDDNRCVMNFTVEVRDREHLQRLLTALRSHPNVISISPHS